MEIPALAHLAVVGYVASLRIFTPAAESATPCLPPAWTPSSWARGILENQARGQHPLPGRVSKTNLWEATELTSFSRSSCCFSPAEGTGQ